MDDKDLDNFFADRLNRDAYFPNREANKQKVFAQLDALKKPRGAWLGKWVYWLPLGLLLLGNGWQVWEMRHLKQELAALKLPNTPLSMSPNPVTAPNLLAAEQLADTIYRTTVVVKTDTIYRNIYVVDKIIPTATPITTTATPTFSNTETGRKMEATSPVLDDFLNNNSKKQDNNIGSTSTQKANQDLTNSAALASDAPKNATENTKNQLIPNSNAIKIAESPQHPTDVLAKTGDSLTNAAVSFPAANAVADTAQQNRAAVTTVRNADTTTAAVPTAKPTEAMPKTDSMAAVKPRRAKTPDTSALKLADIEFEKKAPKIEPIKKPLIENYFLGVQVGAMNFLPFTPKLTPSVSIGLEAGIAFNSRWRLNVTTAFSSFKFETAEAPAFLHLPERPEAPAPDYEFRYVQGTQLSRLLTASVQYVLSPQRRVRTVLSATYSSRIIPTGAVQFEFKKMSVGDERYITRTTDKRIEQLLGGGVGIESDVSRRWMVQLRTDFLYDIKDASVLGVLRGGLVYRF